MGRVHKSLGALVSQASWLFSPETAIPLEVCQLFRVGRVAQNGYGHRVTGVNGEHTIDELDGCGVPIWIRIA